MTETIDVVRKEVFDEAVREGNKAVSSAHRYLHMNRVAVDAIHEALHLIRSGRTLQARERLERSLLAMTRISAGGDNRQEK
jgi:hypothetical protein